MAPLLPVILLSSLLLSLLCLPCINTAPFSLDLMHRDSPQSPFYDPSVTPSQRRQAALRRSSSRLHYLRRATSLQDSTTTTTIPEQNEYMAYFHIGTPPVLLLAVVDTGSDLIWTQCKPCTSCYVQDLPMFDPSASSTYRNATCGSPICTSLTSRASCGAGNTCQYSYAYEDGSYTKGVLATDDMYIAITSPPIPNITFGCTHQSSPSGFDAHGSGLVGLGGGPSSLVSQLGASIDGKFSYCLAPLSSQSATGKLVFGDASAVAGADVVSTPLIQKNPATFYYVTIEALVVNNVTIPATRSQGGIDVVVDTGTTLTYLSSDLVKRLHDELMRVVDLPRPTGPNPDKDYELCYKAGSVTDSRLPSIVVRFAGGAKVTLTSANAFDQVDAGTVCLNIVADPQGGSYVYGDVSQQNFLIGFDLVKKEVSFAPGDCSNV